VSVVLGADAGHNSNDFGAPIMSVAYVTQYSYTYKYVIHAKFRLKSVKGRDHPKELGIDGRITLEWILEK
jgi:hypothetical protein